MAIKKGRLRGLKNVTKNLNKEIKNLEIRVEDRGLLKAGLFVKGEAQKQTPVVEGNLRNSAFVSYRTGVNNGSPEFKGKPAGKMKSDHTQVTAEQRGRVKSSFMPIVVVGFSAVYSVSVHENPRSGKTGGSSISRGARELQEAGKGRIAFSTVGKWKFLEDALKSNTSMVLSILKKEAMIRK